MKKLILASFLVMMSYASLAVDEITKQRMLQQIDTIGEILNTGYAPVDWKKTYAGWDLQLEIIKAKARIENSANLTVKNYQKIVRDFFNSTQDYHVGFSFYSTESASLPLTVKGVGDKYFIVYIDRDKLSETAFPAQVGDELIAFDGKPVSDAIREVQLAVGFAQNGTDRALAEINLTRRRGARGYDVPKGPITLRVKSQENGSENEYQIIWDYTPEKVTVGPYRPIGLRTKISAKSALARMLERKNMLAPVSEYIANSDAANNFMLGTKKSYLPALGTKIWESAPTDNFHAYIYQNSDKKLIGYVRIPSYSVDDSDAAIAEFSKIIKRFEGVTEALVIDQINNPGGSVFYLYALASLLTQSALSTPLHKMRITHADVIDSINILNEIQNVTNDEEAIKAIGPTLGGYPTSYQLALFIKDFCNFIVEQWNDGKNFTEAHHIWGVEKINPYPSTTYSKPIVLITNALDFSGGDFFPAIMQDNKRVTQIGTTTAGAGGYVEQVKFINAFGLESFSYTASIAERIDRNPIENLGVRPDVEYVLQEEDLSGGFQKYKNAINEAVNNKLK